MTTTERWSNLSEDNRAAIKALHCIGYRQVARIDSLVTDLKAATNLEAAEFQRKQLLQANAELQELEFLMQKAWGFQKDVNKHTWWLHCISCICPKADNTDPVYFGGGAIVSGDCPVHGDLWAIHVAPLVKKKMLADLQPIELECSAPSGVMEPVVSPITITGWFSNSRIKDSEVPHGMYRYGLRHADDDNSVPKTLEQYVGVNHYGDILTEQPLPELDICEFYKINDWTFTV